MKKAKVSVFLIDEIKAEYKKVIKKLQVNGIVKPNSNQNIPMSEETSETPLKTALVLYEFIYLFNFSVQLYKFSFIQFSVKGEKQKIIHYF